MVEKEDILDSKVELKEGLEEDFDDEFEMEDDE